MAYELFIGLRYLRSKRRNVFVSLITLISIGGITVGVMAMIVVLGVMTGFEEDLKAKILGTCSDIVVTHDAGEIRDWREVLGRVLETGGVTAATPIVKSQVMCSAGLEVSGAALRGIDTGTVAGVLSIPAGIIDGNLASLDHRAEPVGGESRESLAAVLLGVELARTLGLFVGDEVKVISPVGMVTPMGIQPRVRSFRVGGIFETGLYEHDASTIYMTIDEAQAMVNSAGAVTSIEAKVEDLDRTGIMARSLQAALGGDFEVRDWTDLNKRLFSAMRLEKVTTFIVLTLIVLVAAFNIASALIMVVMEKRKDIAILKSMGATTGSVMKIFIVDGLMIGAVGTVLGILGGWGLCLALKKYQFVHLPGEVFYNYTLPVVIDPLEIVRVACAAVIISFLATLYPSWQASGVQPAAELRYDQ